MNSEDGRIKLSVLRLLPIRHILPSEILDLSIETSSFLFWPYTERVCPPLPYFFLIDPLSRNKIHTCDSFFLRVINYYSLGNVMSCHNVISSDVITMSTKHVNELMIYLHTYRRSVPQSVFLQNIRQFEEEVHKEWNKTVNQ